MAQAPRPPKASRDPVERVEEFVRSYTAGMSGREFQRLFDRDAANAYEVLTRDHDLGPEPAGRCARFVHRTRRVFLGLSYKLSPGRRLLFVGALAAAFFGLFSIRWELGGGAGNRIDVDFSPLWFLASVGCLVYLLALELVDRVRVRDELEVARQLQADLLPREIALVPGYQFAHSYRTANEVGGDYYDVTPLPDGRVALAVGDASGHGMAAGLVMAIANATLETALDLDPSPQAVLRVMNRALCRTGGRRTFMSLFYGLLEPASGRLEYVCAGHPFPLLRRADGTLEELGEGSLPLGLREPLELPVGAATLAAGDTLLLYTDGLVEAAPSDAGETFGFERLRAVLGRGGTTDELHREILAAFDRHIGEEPIRDDLSLLVMARLD